MSARAGATTINLNGFDFSYRMIDTASEVSSEITFQGPGALKSTAVDAAILIGGTGVLGKGTFVNLADIQFSKFDVGGAPLFSNNPNDPFEIIAEGSGLASIVGSTAHGNLVVVGARGTGELQITQSSSVELAAAGMVASKFIVGQVYSGSTLIADSEVTSDSFVVGDGTDDSGVVTNPDLTGELTITHSEVSAGDFRVGFQAKGEVTVNGGSQIAVTNSTRIGVHAIGTMVANGGATRVETRQLIVGDQEGANGTLTIEEASDVIVNLLAIVGHFGTGTAKVLGVGALLEAGRVYIGGAAGIKGELIVQFGGHVVVTDVGRPAGVIEPSLRVGIDGHGILKVEGASRVDIKKFLEPAVFGGSLAEIIANGASQVIAVDEIKQGAGKLEKTIDMSSTVKGKLGELAQLGPATIKIRNESIFEGVEGIEIGGGPGAFVGIWSDAVMSTEDTVKFIASTVLESDSSVIADVAAYSLSNSVVIQPGPEGGGVATLTFQTPEFDASGGMTLVVDAPGPGSNDHLHATGNVALGGILSVNLGYTPSPWTSIGGAGDWIHVLSAEGNLGGEFDEVILPDIESLNLPPPINEAGYGYAWRVVYDRDDMTPDPELLQTHPSFTSQPWLGNGTQDVVLLIRELAYDPVANPDYYTTSSMPGDFLQIDAPGLLENDAYAQATEYVIDSGPTNGTLVFNNDGSFLYAANPGYSGNDSFQYRAVSTIRGVASAPATVTIDVLYQPPVGSPDEYSFTSDFGGYLDVDDPGVLENDSYADSVALVANSGPSQGSLTFGSDGSFVYTPFAPYNGTDYFQYVAIDSGTGNQSAPVTVTIHSLKMYELMLDLPAIESEAPKLVLSDLAPLTREATRRWQQAGVDDETLAARLSDLHFVIANLPGSQLGGSLDDGTIVIDVNAAGYGWFIDTTPDDDDEFARIVSISQRQSTRGKAAGHADLLTVVLHEIGHLLGLDHEHAARSGDATNLMHDTIGLGVRRNPTAWDAAIVDYLYWQSRRRSAQQG